jgi:hypothetical protein
MFESLIPRGKMGYVNGVELAVDGGFLDSWKRAPQRK